MHVNPMRVTVGRRIRQGTAQVKGRLEDALLTCDSKGKPITLGEYVQGLPAPHRDDTTEAMKKYSTMLRSGTTYQIECALDVLKQRMQEAAPSSPILQPPCVLDAVIDSIHTEMVKKVQALGRLGAFPAC